MQLNKAKKVERAQALQLHEEPDGLLIHEEHIQDLNHKVVVVLYRKIQTIEDLAIGCCISLEDLLHDQSPLQICNCLWCKVSGLCTRCQ
jgi:hypothetical protein